MLPTPDQQLQEQLNTQIQTTQNCQTSLKQATDQIVVLQNQNTSLQQQVNYLQSELTDVTNKYNEDERTIIAVKGQLGSLNKEDTDYAIKAFESETLAKSYKSNLVDVAKTIGLDITLPVDQLINAIKDRLQRPPVSVQDNPQPLTESKTPLKKKLGLLRWFQWKAFL